MFEVFKKEVKELLRDKKTLLFVVALPVLIFPILFGLMGFLMSQANLEAEQKVHIYAITGSQYAPEFSEKIKFHKSFKLSKIKYESIEEMKNAVRTGVLDVGIFISSDARASLTQGLQSNWKVVFNDASALSFIYKRVNDAMKSFSEILQAEKFESLGVSKEQSIALLNPIKIEKIDTADKRENIGEKLGAFIPYLLIPLVLAGASYPAIDLGAGEKERGTLETLLLTPVTRTELVLGKFFTVLASSLMTALITVVSMGFWVSIASNFVDAKIITDVMGTIGVLDLSLILLMLVPLAGIFSSLVLAISIYARTFKEAQNYMGPLSMVAFMPLVVAMMPNMELTMNTAMIPITNVALAIKELIKGTVDYSMVAMIFVATFALAGILMGFCVHWFKKESVLFR
ncbi:ABC transporter permease [Pseudoalteromonas denitrificans]|uniref:Sodium transport system permease protein n=1 Tax=Pseudoalteromonas denitrificans DSM 6059 TaxID=1123010 RepID=A0A1I1M1L7_9GAMM|nr:ABC transporter permease [Pseudoalteromonas denitrificans]SFC79279.1 sodium transport system permease protein [Pseudoalteromonas denitrificans DSM 6059]